MGYTKKKFEELSIIDDFLMNAVAGDSEVGEDFCRTLVSALLGRQIGKIQVAVQKTFPGISPAHRGIRLDVEIMEYADDMTVEENSGFPGEQEEKKRTSCSEYL